MLRPQAQFIGLFAEVEGRLTAHGGEDCVDGMLVQNVFQRIHRQRHEVNMIRRHRIGHDGGRVGIDQDNFDAFFAKGAGGLGSRIIKFTGLSDDNGSATDYQDGADRRV